MKRTRLPDGDYSTSRNFRCRFAGLVFHGDGIRRRKTPRMVQGDTRAVSTRRIRPFVSARSSARAKLIAAGWPSQLSTSVY